MRVAGGSEGKMVRVSLAIKLATVTILVLMTANLSLYQATAFSEGSPYPISSYGVVRLSATEDFALGGYNVRIGLASDSAAPFFVVRLLIVLNRPLETDIVLDSIKISDLPPITLTSPTSPNLVVVPAGRNFGEIMNSLPDGFSVMVVKEPMGNLAFPVDGGEVGGLVFTLRFSGGPLLGTTVSAFALITAPTNATVTMQLS